MCVPLLQEEESKNPFAMTREDVFRVARAADVDPVAVSNVVTQFENSRLIHIWLKEREKFDALLVVELMAVCLTVYLCVCRIGKRIPSSEEDMHNLMVRQTPLFRILVLAIRHHTSPLSFPICRCMTP